MLNGGMYHQVYMYMHIMIFMYMYITFPESLCGNNSVIVLYHVTIAC